MPMQSSTKVITADDYEVISSYYANMKNKIDSSASYLWDAVYEITTLDSTEPTYDLIKPFYDTYTAQNSTLTSSAPFLAAVKALNSHVLTRARDNAGSAYPTLMAWMYDNAVMVDSAWAEMSADAGYPITINATYVTNP